jgi:zinc/manganese transport system substrate-binding protein
MINKGYNLKALTNDNSLLLAINYIENPRSFNKDEVVRVGRKEYLRNGSRVHLNPHNIDKIAAEFTRRVKLLDPIHANFYEKSYRDFAIKWQEAIKKWEERAFTLRGMPLIANDNSWNYLADWLGLEITTIIDSETMAKANPTSLQALVKKLKTNPVEAIIFARWEDKRNLLWLRDTAKVRVVSLPYSVGGSANNSDLFKLFDSIINGLLTDCSSGVCRSLAPPKTSTVKLR